MGLLTNALRDEFKSTKCGTEYTVPTICCGIDVLDYRNGKVTINDNGEEEFVLGFDCGKIIQLIGKSGSSKTTLAIQMAYNMIKPFAEGTVVHKDFERSTTIERLMNLTGAESEEELKSFYIHHIKDICTEEAFDTVKAIKNTKLGKGAGKGKNATKYDQDLIDSLTYENPWKPGHTLLVPTVYLIDSLATMMPRDAIDEDKMSGQMQAASVAKQNTQWFKALLSDFMDANIIPIIINHITQKISINPMQPLSAEIPFLKQDEGLPGTRF